MATFVWPCWRFRLFLVSSVFAAALCQAMANFVMVAVLVMSNRVKIYSFSGLWILRVFVVYTTRAQTFLKSPPFV